MSPDLAAALRAQYSAMLPARPAFDEESAQPFRFSCDDGWFSLIDDHLAVLQALADDGRIATPVAIQIKQKLGQLRVSLQNETPETRALAERSTTEVGCDL